MTGEAESEAEAAFDYLLDVESEAHRDAIRYLTEVSDYFSAEIERRSRPIAEAFAKALKRLDEQS